ncbi:biorientation of chromosomes in cell division protein 1-like 1 [Diachasmimorpha longicaudata]|uniref:biorientation of chromosomes in cell division protein 1-like 1 n=1 Tax=Diachasmimorpha longicaudata TaxID=58733 RepID=UPI0030B91B84
MNLGLGSTLLPGDPRLIDHIVGEVKSQGIFDQFRKECIADVDTKPAYQNLRTRVESSVNSFLYKQRWRADLNKNQLRETLRKHISDGPYLDMGVERIVDQVVNPKIYSVFMPQVEDVVHEFLGLEKPKREKNGDCGFKDLLPKDLDPVSPESDKNSLKDISLDSVDANLIVPGEEEGPSIKRELEESEMKVEVKTEELSHVENDLSNGRMEEEAERSLDEPMDLEGNTPPPPDLNDSAQLEDKEEEEEDSPVFEPIDIMNLNESNISNDSHLSGISELTSHRSRSPAYSNDFSRDNFDFSNQDSQLSKVSSDSRLSIVTDFGSSNQPTPVPDLPKDDSSKDKFPRESFKEIPCEGDQLKDNKMEIKQKENLLEMKDGSDTRSSKTNLSSKESSRDGMESVKEKSGHKSKEKIRDLGKSKTSKERPESRSRRDREKDKKKSSHVDRPESSDKRTRDKSENSRDSTERIKEARESRDVKENKDTPTKVKEEKPKESPSKEGKDLKDIYKEKIRELREKKELTEKEKLSKDSKESKESSKDAKSSKDSKEKRDSSRDKEKHRSSSSRTHSSSRHESRSSKSSRDDSKSSKNEKEKAKREDSHRSKDGKSKVESESNEKSEKSESKKSSKYERDEKSESKDSKTSQKSTKKESKSDSKTSERSEKREDKEGKDKRRKEEKKSKSKDDHSSLRKGSNDRRSSDRDGSSGSSGRGSQKSASSPSASSSKPTASLGKDSSTNSNSSSETSDGIDEPQTEELKPSEPDMPQVTETKVEIQEKKIEIDEPEGIPPKRIDLGQSELCLPLKKRPLQSEDLLPRPNEPLVKKSKLTKNFPETKKPMKMRKKIDRDHSKDQPSVESTSPVSELSEVSEAEGEVHRPVPDEERVQIIEVQADEEDEPYPGTKCSYNLEDNSKIILSGNEILSGEIVTEIKTKSTLSDMELSIRQSLTEMISDNIQESSGKSVEGVTTPEATPGSAKSEPSGDYTCVEKIELKAEVGEEQEMESKKEQVKVEYPEEAVPRSLMAPLGNSKEVEEEAQKALGPPEPLPTPGTSSKNLEPSDDEEDCRYFLVDNERLNRFTAFMSSLGLIEDFPSNAAPEKPSHPLVECPEARTMAPPLPKRKYSTSPLSDILLNNSNNNNEGHKLETTIYQEEGQTAAKRKKLGRPRKQRLSVNSPSPHMMNGENFVLPMSPESDASATSDKTPSSLKDERNRSRGNNQRYTSDDLYKPRPLFASSSRRSRRSNP